FSTVADGVKGKRAKEWGLVDDVYMGSKYDEQIVGRVKELAAQSTRPDGLEGITLDPIEIPADGSDIELEHVSFRFDRAQRLGTLVVRGPSGAQPADPDAIHAAGSDYWPLRAFRELDRILLHLRLNEPEIGTVLVKSEGDAAAVLASDAVLDKHRDHWLVNEIIQYIKRTLKRVDYTAKSFLGVIEPGSCFAGTLFELILCSDRSYMLDDPDRPVTIELSVMNGGSYPMGNGLSRLETRFLNDPGKPAELLGRGGAFEALDAEESGLVTFAPDDIDWDDDVRFAIEERTSLSPDALTGMEANLRFGGPETMETKIFGRLTAWQNWIFQRPNAVGERGALKIYGQAGIRPEFDWRRT
ncbi:MAG: benzoyl-CoA-dihydrodiol lyase, partial [Gemmatimonadetes bacterium]|nr:benzoyl-CoA-dihydrodiol lyase [Gemmatimonadota bacterium]